MGNTVVVEVSILPSARTIAMVFNTVDESVMALPLAICQHGSTSSNPSPLSEGNPLASCQM